MKRIASVRAHNEIDRTIADVSRDPNQAMELDLSLPGKPKLHLFVVGPEARKKIIAALGPEKSVDKPKPVS
jgi:hypothetical protein